MIVQMALKKKQSVMIGPGEGVGRCYHDLLFSRLISRQIWNRIHIQDLSRLYYLLVQAALDDKANLPNGKTGYFFAENGDQSWKDIAERIGQTGKELGVFESSEVISITLQEAADEFYEGQLRDTEGVLASKYVGS